MPALMPYITTYQRTPTGLVRMHRGICSPPVPLRERLADKLADLLIAASDVIDLAADAGNTVRIYEDLGLDDDLAGSAASRSRLTRDEHAADDERYRRLLYAVFSDRPESISPCDRATTERVERVAKDIYVSVNLLLQEIAD